MMRKKLKEALKVVRMSESLCGNECLKVSCIVFISLWLGSVSGARLGDNRARRGRMWW